MGGESDVWQTLENDPFLCQFLQQHNQVTQKNEVGPISQTLAVSDQLSKLAHGISLLEKELHSQVLENHEHLVSQATWVDRLESILADMQSHVQRLVSSVERLRTKIVDPFSKLQTQTIMLSRLHATSDLLRRTARIQQLDELCRDVDLSGLEILEEDHRLIKTETNRVEKEARQMLNQGLNNLNHSQVNTGLQVFQNLGKLEQEVNILTEKAFKKAQQQTEKALDIQNFNQTSSTDRSSKSKGPGRVTGSMYPGNVTNFRNSLWTAIENLLYNVIFNLCSQMAMVQKVLCNIKGINSDSSKHSETAIIFWDQMNGMITSQLSLAAQNSSFIKQALEGEYPKLLRLHLDLHKRLEADTLTTNIYPNSGDCGHQFETAYLSKSVARLFDSIHSMFSTEGPPSTEQVDNLMRTITNELSVSLVEESLSLTVARNIGKAVRLFCLKGEHMLAVGGDASQVIEPPTNGQALNVSIANIAFYLVSQIQRVMNNMAASLSTAPLSEINKALGNADNLTHIILNPIITSINDAIESIILTMHQEDFNKVESSPAVSLYMRELQSFLGRAALNYLAPFQHQQIISSSCIEVASRCIELFLRHASLVRPVSAAGRIKLAIDMKQIETAVSPLCKQLSELGRTYRLLRSFRPLIETSPEEVAECNLLGELIPHSLALMSLFNRAPPEIPSPHQSANWSVARLSQWLDGHRSEKERLELLSGALQKYQQTVRQQNKDNFHPIYPIMINILEKGLEYINNNTSASLKIQI
uniref:Conserved oligomeric Golgi complex subunit 5 n=1 Tax=Clastoptera arizonana TaxID=38151 RepID=A0A1B6CBT0_9HEMI